MALPLNGDRSLRRLKIVDIPRVADLNKFVRPDPGTISDGDVVDSKVGLRWRYTGSWRI